LKDELKRMELIAAHGERVNDGDVDALLALYTETAGFEDPVGSGQRSGLAALRGHFEQVVAAGTRQVNGKPVAGQDGLHALMPVTAVMDFLPLGPAFAERGWITLPPGAAPRRLRYRYVLMIRTSTGVLIEDSKAFWGRTDIEVIQ
jgi:steroid Delta-isomerase